MVLLFDLTGSSLELVLDFTSLIGVIHGSSLDASGSLYIDMWVMWA